jgi:O-antigen chain-terminating methyltransferase
VSERVGAYLDDILAVASELPVLDVGCGRGELLEQLEAADAPCYGIEVDPAYAALGRERGLDVRLVDARAHMESLEPASLRALSAIQVVEHLATDDVIGLLDHAMRAIEPGGLLVLETPNPDNLIVGASSFYLDPTHLHPIPPLLLAFLVEARGFVDVEVRPLARRELQPMAPPAPDQPWSEDLGRVVAVLNTWLFGAQDYAVLARRP